MKRDIIEHIMMRIGAKQISDNSFIYQYKDKYIDTINVDSDGLMLFLLSPDCAKALFGNKEIHLAVIDKRQVAWKYHLQRMVLEEDRLEYIEKFLKDEKN